MNPKASLERYNKDVSFYQKEIEELKEEIRTEIDEFKLEHLGKLLLETQRALATVLNKIEELQQVERVETLH